MLRLSLAVFTLCVYFKPMCIEIVSNRSSHRAVLLRECGKTPKTPKRPFANLSCFPPSASDMLRRSLNGDTLVSPEEAVQVERSVPCGHVAAVLGTVRSLGLHQVLQVRAVQLREVSWR